MGSLIHAAMHRRSMQVSATRLSWRANSLANSATDIRLQYENLESRIQRDSPALLHSGRAVYRHCSRANVRARGSNSTIETGSLDAIAVVAVVTAVLG